MAYKGGPPAKAPALDKMRPAELIDQLASPERWVRQQAKELLYRLPTEAVVASGRRRGWRRSWLAKNLPARRSRE